jgi:hypothetical protein
MVVLIFSALSVKSLINFECLLVFWFSLNRSDLFLFLEFEGGFVENFFGLLSMAKILGADPFMALALVPKKYLVLWTGERSMFGCQAESRSG